MASQRSPPCDRIPIQKINRSFVYGVQSNLDLEILYTVYYRDGRRRGALYTDFSMKGFTRDEIGKSIDRLQVAGLVDHFNYPREQPADGSISSLHVKPTIEGKRYCRKLPIFVDLLTQFPV
ncbi:MAG: hypothetical protein HYX24_01645 [Candidatus Aenigmarchaeota archaeon]|nr:hypothetical protein [Candidatus Aenigmarchaeota archaeon]